jgi:hypothetical protein
MSRSFDYEADAARAAAVNVIPNTGGLIPGQIREADGSDMPCVLDSNSKTFEGDLSLIKTTGDEQLVQVGGVLRRYDVYLAELEAMHAHIPGDED